MFVGFVGNAFNRGPLRLETGAGRVGASLRLVVSSRAQGQLRVRPHPARGHPRRQAAAPWPRRNASSIRGNDHDRGPSQHPEEDLYVVFTGIAGNACEIKAHVRPLVF